MDFHIVCLVENQFSTTEIGFVETSEDRDTINNLHRNIFETWHENNISEIEAGTITVINYFDENPSFHECKISTSTLTGRENLSLLTNLTTLE